VTVLDDFNDFYDPALKRRNVAALLGRDDYRLVEGDIRDEGKVETLFRDGHFDAVVHLAARAGVRPSLKEPILYEDVNCIGTLRLLEAAKKHGPEVFVFGSSSSVYGINEKVPFAECDPVDLPIQQWTGNTPVPATEQDARGGWLADYWAAHTHGAVNLALDDMARASTLDAAIAASAKARIPTQNMLVVDATGKAAWTLLGGVPDRPDTCQMDTHDGDCIGWQLKDKPATDGRIESTRLWTANNRVVDGATLAEVGDGGYALGARARQIRNDLRARQTFTERDLLAIQLDDRALFLQRWWRLLQDTAARSHSPALVALASSATGWWR
jgi:hypothetical protein